MSHGYNLSTRVQPKHNQPPALTIYNTQSLKLPLGCPYHLHAGVARGKSQAHAEQIVAD